MGHMTCTVRSSPMLQVLELKGSELEPAKEIEKPSGFRCATFGASSIRDRHLATGNFKGEPSPHYEQSASAATLSATYLACLIHSLCVCI